MLSPIASKIEDLCEKCLKDLLGLPDNTVAGFVSDSSTASLCGLIAARNYLLSNMGGDKVDLRFYNIKNKFFHPKLYIFEYEEDGDAYIGLQKNK